MKPALLLVVLLVVFSAAPAAAVPGVNLTWGDRCSLDGNIDNLTWACDNDTSTKIRLTCSFMLPEPKTNFAAVDFYLEGRTGSDRWTPPTAPVPDWWKLGASDCRANSISLSTENHTSCADPWSGAGEQVGGIGLYSWDTYGMHVNATWAVLDPGTVPANQELFAGQFRISAQKTTGAGACGGCTDVVTWAINYLQIAFYNEVASLQLGEPLGGGQQTVTWQVGLVPVRPATWGRIKSLYR